MAHNHGGVLFAVYVSDFITVIVSLVIAKSD